MLKKIALGLVISMSCILNATAKDNIPDGWFKAGSKPSEYVVGTDAKNTSDKKGKSVFIQGTTNNIEDFGTLMQNFKATKYLGKRLKFSANVKTDGVIGWAGLWMRIDGQDGKSISIDNMSNRAITGTKPWKSYSVVLDVPQNSSNIAFGVLTSGKGKVWLDNIKFTVVDRKTPVTSMESDEPQNLNFEK